MVCSKLTGEVLRMIKKIMILVTSLNGSACSAYSSESRRRIRRSRSDWNASRNVSRFLDAGAMNAGQIDRVSSHT